MARAASVSSSRSRLLGLAAEDPGDLPPAGVTQLAAGVVDLLGSVEQGSVVDPDGVRVLVLDDGAVHQRGEVAKVPWSCRSPVSG